MMPGAAVLLTATVVALAATATIAGEAREAARCAAIESAEARLACYDALFRQPAQTPEARRAREVHAFGDREELRRERGEARAGDAGPDRIEAKVTAARERADGTWQITLDNGQVWVTLESALLFAPREGSTVSIRRAALGSFLLRADGSRAVRARRVR